MTAELRLFFHFRSPYSRLGLRKLCAAGVPGKVATRTVVLTKSAGEDTPINPTRTPARLAYILQDVGRMTARAGLPLAMPTPLDPDYKPAYGAFFAARAAGKGLEFADALSDLRWGEGANISEPDVIARAFAAAGLSPDTVFDGDLSAMIAADVAQLEADGAFGVPFAVLEKDGTKHLFFGQDRFDLLIEML